MKFFSLGHRLPYRVASKLFGDRRKFGLVPVGEDPSWHSWKTDTLLRFYNETQKQSFGRVVNDAGYSVLRDVELSGKRILEIGPGNIPHLAFWKNTPAHIALADIQEEMLELSARKLDEQGISYSTALLPENSGGSLPFADEEFDLVFSFYSLEHLYPLGPSLDEIVRCLKPGGRVVGAIPTEGGLAWGLGRFLTSRRWLLNNTDINPDKLICWEHPNFADYILNQLSERLEHEQTSYFPLGLPALDVNLIVRFVFRKRV